MSVETTLLTPELYQYMLSISKREPSILAALRQETAKQFTSYAMQVASEQAQFLVLLLKLMGAKQVIEIGTFTGYSSLALAQALPADGQIITCDINKKTTEFAKHYWQQAGVIEKITSHLAPAEETLKQLLNAGQAEKFDLVFIDADKKNHEVYFELALQLIRKGGLIAIDNVFMHGKVLDSERSDSVQHIDEFNQQLAQDSRVDISVVPLGDGLTLARKSL